MEVLTCYVNLCILYHFSTTFYSYVFPNHTHSPDEELLRFLTMLSKLSLLHRDPFSFLKISSGNKTQHLVYAGQTLLTELHPSLLHWVLIMEGIKSTLKRCKFPSTTGKDTITCIVKLNKKLHHPWTFFCLLSSIAKFITNSCQCSLLNIFTAFQQSLLQFKFHHLLPEY
jgi:hypothetical protein